MRDKDERIHRSFPNEELLQPTRPLIAKAEAKKRKQVNSKAHYESRYALRSKTDSQVKKAAAGATSNEDGHGSLVLYWSGRGLY